MRDIKTPESFPKDLFLKDNSKLMPVPYLFSGLLFRAFSPLILNPVCFFLSPEFLPASHHLWYLKPEDGLGKTELVTASHHPDILLSHPRGKTSLQTFVSDQHPLLPLSVCPNCSLAVHHSLWAGISLFLTADYFMFTSFYVVKLHLLHQWSSSTQNTKHHRAEDAPLWTSQELCK